MDPTLAHPRGSGPSAMQKGSRSPGGTDSKRLKVFPHPASDPASGIAPGYWTAFGSTGTAAWRSRLSSAYAASYSAPVIPFRFHNRTVTAAIYPGKSFPMASVAVSHAPGAYRTSHGGDSEGSSSWHSWFRLACAHVRATFWQISARPGQIHLLAGQNAREFFCQAARRSYREIFLSTFLAKPSLPKEFTTFRQITGTFLEISVVTDAFFQEYGKTLGQFSENSVTSSHCRVAIACVHVRATFCQISGRLRQIIGTFWQISVCLLYTSDAADE